MEEVETFSKKILDSYFGLIFKTSVLIVLLSTLFLFANLTTEFFDTPKFIVLLVFTGVLLVTLTLRYTFMNKVVFIRTPLDLPLLLLLVVAIVSTALSSAPYISLLGNQLKVASSLVGLITYILFYFVLTNGFKSLKEIKGINNILLMAGTALGAYSLLSFFGISILPAPWTGVSFTSTGSSFSTTAVLALLVPLATSQIISSSNIVSKSLNALYLTVFGVTIVLIGSWASWIGAGAGFLLVLFVSGTIKDLSNLTELKPINLLTLVTPVVITVLALFLSFMPPVGGASNPIYTQYKNFPREIQLPIVSSWKIAISAFRDSPFWGTGPSTFLFNFTNYKPVEFNQAKFWNLRFDSAFNTYMEVLATLGGVGLLALLSLTAMFISSAYSSLRTTNNEQRTALAISGVVFFIIISLHSATLALWVVGLFILASFFVVRLLENPSSNEFSNKNMRQILSSVISNRSQTETIRIEALPSILLTVFAALVLGAFFFGGKFVLADYHHRLALNAVSKNNGLLAYNELVIAEKLNSVNDLYRTDLAQINFALANSIASAKGPTESSPSGSLTDQDKQNIQVLLQQSINEGKTATILNPKSAINWEILALLYRQVAGVAQNALLFSLDAYGKAIFQDPFNPQLRLNVGGTYYAVKAYDLAIRFFTDSINLKPDFANGYYNLSVALRDKGDMPSALQAAEKVVELVDKNSSDYKIATDYLADLKNKAGVPAEPPAATTSGALQDEKLPKITDLGKPEKISTPAAIKKPGATPTP